MNLPWFLMRVHWPTTMQDFRGLQGDKSKFWVGFLRGYSKNYPLRHIQTGSFPYSSDGKYRLSIMMHGLPTQSLSKYYDLSNIFAIHSCLQPIKSEKWHFHLWRKRFVQSQRTCQKYWVFNERNPVFVYKIYHERRPNSMLTTRALSYLSINCLKDSGRCWFKASAMGVNKAGLDERWRLMNQSTRKTPLQ